MGNVRLKATIDRRASKVVGSSDPLIWGTNNSSSGKIVTSTTAMQISAVFGCVRILSSTLGMTPLIMYRRLPGGGKERATDHPLYRILHDVASREQSAFTWREMSQGHLALRGNAYSFIVRKNNLEVEELIPLNPNTTCPKKINGEIYYEYWNSDGKKFVLDSSEVLHIRALAMNGMTGIDPIMQLRDLFGSALAAREHGARFFANGARASGTLSHPGRLNEEGIKKLKTSFERNYSGVENAGKTIVLEEGMTYSELGMTMEQAQFLEVLGFDKRDIAATVFGVPPHMMGEETSAFTSNLQQYSQQFITYTMGHWYSRWCSELSRSLLTTDEQEEYFFEFLTDSFLRGDPLSRGQALALQRQNGIINADEWREIENMNPLPDGAGKIYLNPMNMAVAGGNNPAGVKEPTPVGKTLPSPEPQDKNAETKELIGKILKTSQQIVAHELVRILRRQNKSVPKTDESWKTHAEFIRDAMKPYADFICSQVVEVDSALKCTVEREEICRQFAEYWCEDSRKESWVGEEVSIQTQRFIGMVRQSFGIGE